MGAGHFDLWKQGMDPRNMVYIKDNPVRGGSPSVKTFDMMGAESPQKSSSTRTNTSASTVDLSTKETLAEPQSKDIYLFKAGKTGEQFDSYTVCNACCDGVETISNTIDPRVLDEQAREVSDQRNVYKSAARNATGHQETRRKLDETKPIKSFEKIAADKIKRKNRPREEALHDIIKRRAKQMRK